MNLGIDKLKNASALKTVSFQLELITPLFVHGWHKSIGGGKSIPVSAEWRIPSWRGIMRYWWRALQIDDPQSMRINEEKRFGGTSDSVNAQKSPVNFRFYSEDDLQNNSNRNDICPATKRDMAVLAIPAGRSIRLDMHFAKRHAHEADFYENLCQFVFMTAGMGQRARRGGGAVQTKQWKDIKEFSDELKNNLRQAGVSDHFEMDGIKGEGILVKRKLGEASHPTLQTIYLGRGYDNAEEVRKAIDASALNANDPSKTQHLGKSSVQRLSSPLWCTVRKIDKFYYPLISELNSPHISETEYRKQRDLFLDELGVKRQ